MQRPTSNPDAAAADELVRLRARLTTLERELEDERKARFELAAQLRMKGIRSDLERMLEHERARNAALTQQLETAWRQLNHLDDSIKGRRGGRWRRVVGRS